MIRWLRSLFAWDEIRNTGVWSYQVNAVTGGRRVRRRLEFVAGGYQPVDLVWVRTGKWVTAMAPRGPTRFVAESATGSGQ